MKNNIIFNTTDTLENPIKSSAIVYSSRNASSVYFIHHGTIFTNDMTPTNANMYDSIAKLFLDKNCTVIFPDYIGFGVSYNDTFHPYLHKKTLAQNSFDLLCHLYNENIISQDIKVFSAGYSEGGYASLAFVELAQQKNIIIDSINGAAPYDILETLSNSIKNTSYEYPEYFSYIAHSYENIYQLDGLLSNMFKGIYPKIIYKAYRDRYPYERMHKIFPKEISRYINIEFLHSEDGLSQLFKEKLQENSLKSFTPIGNTTLFSARSDEVVDVKTTISTYKYFKDRRKSNIFIKIDEESDSSHFNSYPKFLKLLVQSLWVNS